MVRPRLSLHLQHPRELPPQAAASLLPLCAARAVARAPPMRAAQGLGPCPRSAIVRGLGSSHSDCERPETVTWVEIRGCGPVPELANFSPDCQFQLAAV